MGRIKRIALERELDERLRWLIKIRWFAAAGVTGVILSTRFAMKIDLDLLPLFMGCAFLLGYNGVFYVINRQLILRRGQPGWFPMAMRLANFQIGLDLFLLAYFLHFSGGMENPFIFYFIFHMVIASMLLSTQDAYRQATLAVLLLTAVAALESFGIIEHHHLNGFVPHAPDFLNLKYTIGVLLIVASTLYITVFLTTSIVSRLRKGERSILMATERLAMQDKAKSEYVKKVSHDIQSSLSTIQTCLQVVLDGTTGPVSDKSREMIQRAENRSELLIKFVRDLLNLSSIRARGQMDMQIISLKNTCEKVTDQHQILARAKKQTLTAAFQHHHWVRVNAFAIEELLSNLVSNAIRYTPEGGRIKITAESFSDSEVQVAVSDTGIGIPAEDLPNIFKDFYRAKNARTHEKSGTGLGLSIAKQIVTSHGGQIWAESADGRGTTFYFTLPKAESEA
jgi:signal transduction histidine kinase